MMLGIQEVRTWWDDIGRAINDHMPRDDRTPTALVCKILDTEKRLRNLRSRLASSIAYDDEIQGEEGPKTVTPNSPNRSKALAEFGLFTSR